MNKKEYHIPSTFVISVNDEGILAALTGASTGPNTSGGFKSEESITVNEKEKGDGASYTLWGDTEAD